MNMIITAIKDEAVDTYGLPLFFRTIAEARRMFTNEVNNPESRINRNPEDFTMYHIGVYNDEAGEVQGSKPEKLARALDVLKGAAT